MMSKNITDLTFFEQNSFGDQSLYRELLTIFVKTTPEMVEQMKAAAANEDYNQLAKTSHKLKSNIQSVGLTGVYAQLDKIELIEQSPVDKGELKIILSQIANQAQIAVSEIQAELNKL